MEKLYKSVSAIDDKEYATVALDR